MNNKEIYSKLRNNFCSVKFKKRDGSLRTMKCTLDSDYLTDVVQLPPLSKPVETDYTRDVVTVYDLEKAAWRSFKPSTMISLETE